MSEKKSKAQRVMVTEEDMGDHTKIAIPSEIGNHFVGLGARFGRSEMGRVTLKNSKSIHLLIVDVVLQENTNFDLNRFVFWETENEKFMS